MSHTDNDGGDFRKMQALFENEEKDNDLIHAENGVDMPGWHTAVHVVLALQRSYESDGLFKKRSAEHAGQAGVLACCASSHTARPLNGLSG